MRSPTLGLIPGLPEKFGRDFAIELFRRANFSRHFEFKVKEAAEKKLFAIPIYLSIGTEFNAAALSLTIPKFKIFAQHRGHSTYLSFGGDPEALRDELLGLDSGCSGGMSGSNAIQGVGAGIEMYGHSGLMGEQVPIAVGAALASGKPCLTICGDGSVEEDYIYPSLGFAGTHKFPVLFVCEDNDLSILTDVATRRRWSAVDVAQSLKVPAVDITDDPWLVAHHASAFAKDLPGFINIRSTRVLWHAGTGIDGPPEWDRYELTVKQMKAMGLEDEIRAIDRENQIATAKLWEKQLQR